MVDFLLSGYSWSIWLLKIFAAITVFLIILSFVTVFSIGEVSTYKLEATTLVESFYLSFFILDPLTQKEIPGTINSNFSIPVISFPNQILMKITLQVGNDSIVKFFPDKILFERFEVLKNFEQQVYSTRITKPVYVKDKSLGGTLVFDVLVKK